MSQLEFEPRASKLPLATLAARVVTLASLVVSIAILKMNAATYELNSKRFIFRYTEVYSFRYMLFSMVVAFAYTLLQIPFAIYYLKTGKRLIKRYGILKFDFYADKVISFIIATGVGAAFGATVDVKHCVDNGADFFRNTRGVSDYISKMDDFFNMAYISAGFLLIGFLSSGFSSIISSIALAKEE